MNEEQIKKVQNTAMGFAKKHLVFTDDLCDYDKGQYAGFLEGAKFGFGLAENELDAMRRKYKNLSDSFDH